MFTNTDSIKLIFEDAFRSIIDNLASTRLTLEDLYTSNERQLPEKEFLNDLRRMSNIVDKIELVDGIEKLDLISEYEVLLNQFKIRYSNFLNNDMISNIEHLKTKVSGAKRLIAAYDYLFQAVINIQDNYKDSIAQVRQMATGMSLLSEALEQNIAYYYSSSKQLIEIFRNTSLAMLKLAASKPENLQSEELNDYFIALKNTSRNILWQLDHYQKLEKNGKPFQKTTLKDVAGYLKYSGEPKSINELNF